MMTGEDCALEFIKEASPLISFVQNLLCVLPSSVVGFTEFGLSPAKPKRNDYSASGNFVNSVKKIPYIRSRTFPVRFS